jgi:hypothetical protein
MNPMNSMSPTDWNEQAHLVREIQHLRTAARLLALGKPGRARASEAALDLAKAREVAVLPQTREMLLMWAQVTHAAQSTQSAHVAQPPELTDQGDQLLWLVKHHSEV